ncbi:MAG: hypothetical protein D8M59_12925 [Planctomycetes bacterium]|nr:hypothetical protein [Planctomycetota bacterium]NOG53720.1 hypothetical protein [Planctomycetota bacterium]
MSVRGIVIGPRLEFTAKSVSIRSFDQAALRQYLLYWDKLDWPKNNRISVNDQEYENLQLLTDVGVLERTDVRFAERGIGIAQALWWSQMLTLAARDEKEPGRWAIGQHLSAYWGPSENTVERRLIEVELYNAIPVPKADVPFERILGFKAKRRSELLSLRAHMDDLYQSIIAAGDIPRAKTTAIDKVQNAIQDLHAVFGESFSSRLLASVKVELNVHGLLSGAVGALAAGCVATSFGFSIGVAAAVGAACSAVKFDMPFIRPRPKSGFICVC